MDEGNPNDEDSPETESQRRWRIFRVQTIAAATAASEAEKREPIPEEKVLPLVIDRIIYEAAKKLSEEVQQEGNREPQA